MIDIICNGVNFKKDLGIIVNKISPDNVLSEKRIEKLTFPRIDGTVYHDNETHESYPLDIECTIKEFNSERIKIIKEVLKDRECELIISKRPGIVFKARLISKIDFNRLIARAGTFLLTYEVHPYAELISGREWIVVSSGQKIKNLGNYKSNPLIKVTGTGNVTITYNSKSMKFTNVSKTFIVDCELEDVYGLDGENLNNYMDINSDYISFQEGEFTISYIGASRVEVMPRWREL